MKFTKKNKNMKNFFFKSILIFFLFIISFHFTFNIAIKKINQQIYEITTKENVEKIKNQIRDEMKNAIEKDNYINKDDARLISSFLKKIIKELEINF